VNRTARRARQLAGSVGGTAAPLAELAGQLAAADLVISCTGAAGHVIGTRDVAAALAARGPAAAPLVLLDLAMPRDVAPEAAGLPGAAVISLAELAEAGLAGEAASTVEQVREIVAGEFAAWASAGRATQVTPTVRALRAKAAGVVDAETARLGRRLPGLDDRARQEIAQAMHRIADKLLHAPTVRVKELAGSPGADSYEAALRVLFDLDPAAVRAVAGPDPGLSGWPGPGPGPDAGGPPGAAT